MATENTWTNLPNLLIVEVFTYLTLTELLRASSICRRYRECLYHPRLWTTINFKVTLHGIDSCHHLTKCCGLFVNNIIINIEAHNTWCINEGLKLMKALSENHRICTLKFVPSSCQFVWTDLRHRASTTERNLIIDG